VRRGEAAEAAAIPGMTPAAITAPLQMTPIATAAALPLSSASCGRNHSSPDAVRRQK
jgi:hypothetical protein